MKPKSKSYNVELYSDALWKLESGLSKLEVVLDDERNPCADFSDIGDQIECGKKYRVTITLQEA